MPLAKNIIRVLPPVDETVVVDILDSTGSSVGSAYTGERRTGTIALPATITEQTDFHLQSTGTYDVSVKVNDTEVASASGAQRVSLVGGPPVLVAPAVSETERSAMFGSGGSSAVVVSKTGNYTASANDAVLADASGGGFTVTLPAPAANATVTVKKVDNGTNVVTVAPHAGEAIDEQASNMISSAYVSRTFISDGTDWWVI